MPRAYITCTDYPEGDPMTMPVELADMLERVTGVLAEPRRGGSR